MDQIDYGTICKYTGKLYIELQHELERQSRQIAQMNIQLQEKDRIISELQKVITDIRGG